MPTPFMHLQAAEQIRAQTNGRLHQLLQEEWPAFYFGSVAPDYQSVCGIPREKTHFYGIPPDPNQQAHLTMMAQYPTLAAAAELPRHQAVFVIAYSIHLVLDLVWFRDILVPYFWQSSALAALDRRLVHFILLTYLDKLALETLPHTAGATLAAAQADQWLPFAQNDHLSQWQGMLVAQLKPGAAIQTVEIYAQRLGMTPAEFAANLNDPDWMADQVFNRLPVAQIQAILEDTLPKCVDLMSNYFQLNP